LSSQPLGKPERKRREKKRVRWSEVMGGRGEKERTMNMQHNNKHDCTKTQEEKGTGIFCTSGMQWRPVSEKNRYYWILEIQISKSPQQERIERVFTICLVCLQSVGGDFRG
jgi:hypothetical protein